MTRISRKKNSIPRPGRQERTGPLRKLSYLMCLVKKKGRKWRDQVWKSSGRAIIDAIVDILRI